MSGADIIARNEKKKKQKESNVNSGGRAIIRRNIENNARNIVFKELNLIRTTQETSQKSAKTRFSYDKEGNRLVSYLSDTKDYLDKVSKDKDEYQKKKDYINYIIKEYGAKISDEDKKTVTDYLNSSANDYNKYYDELEKIAKSDHEYYSQWENEEAYNYSVSKAEKEKRYSKMSDDELEAEIEKLGGKNDGLFGIIANGVKKGFNSFALKNLEKDVISANVPESTKNQIIADIEDEKNKTAENDSDLALLQKEKINRKIKALDSLPDNVKKLIEEYTVLDREKEEGSLKDDATALVAGLNGTGGSYDLGLGSSRREEIAKELNSLGVENWEELVGYNRIRRDENYYNESNNNYAEDAKSHPVLASIATIPASATKLMGAKKVLENAFEGSDVPLNYNSPYFAGNNFVNTTRETVMDNYDWEGKITNIDWFDQIYSTAMSTGDSLLNMALTGGTKMGGVVLGVTAMSDTAQEVARNGGSKEQALLTGVIAGINEMLWENVSIGQFKSLAEKGIKNLVSKKGVKTLAGNILKSAGVNASEEFNTEAANIIVDYLINGGLSSYAESYDAYRQGGYTETEARKRARNDMIYQTVMSGVGGAMQGLFMGGTGSALGGITTKSQYSQQANNMTPEEISTLQTRAKELGIKESDINVNVGDVGPWGESGRVSEKKLSNLISAVEDAEAENAKNELVKEARKYGIDTTQYNLKNNEGIKALSSAVAETETRMQNEANQLSDSIYKNALKERLVSLGESESYSTYAAENLIRKYNGETLDSYRESSTKTKSAEIAYSEFLSAGENGPQWVKDVDERVESACRDLERTYTRSETTEATETIEAVQDGFKTESAVPVQRVNTAPVVSEAAENFAVQMETPQKQEAARRLYIPALDRTTDFKTAFDAYYNAGLKGIGSFEAIDKYYSFAHSFPLYWRKNVFSAGRENKVYNPGVNAFYQSRLTATQKNQIRIMDEIGKKFGISFLVYDRLKDDGAELNGMQLSGTNKILVSLDADGKLYLRTAGHECFHLIEEWNAAEAEKLTEKVVGYLKNSADYDYSAQVQWYAQRYNVDPNTADGLKIIHSEMAADCMFDVFSNERFIKDIVEKNRTLAQKLKDVLQNFLKQLRNMMNSFKESAEMNALREQTEALEDIRTSFHNALRAASEEMQNSLKNEQKNNAFRTDGTEKAENGVRFSIRQEYEKDFNPNGETLEKQLQDALDTSQPKDWRYVYVGEFTQSFINKLKDYIEIKNYPIVMNYRDAYISMESKEFGKYRGERINYHNLGVKGLAKALKSFDNPECVLLSKKENKIELILQGEDYKGRQLFSIVEVNTKTQHNKNFIDVHVVASVYGSSGLKNRIMNAENEGRLIYKKNEESSQGIPQVQYKRDFNDNSSNTNLPQNDNGVNSNSIQPTSKNSNSIKIPNTEFSLSDSEGRELSTEQREYFKDSKIKDANGNLKVMHHGSHESFTVFDKKKARSSGTYGNGFYFTDSKSHAGTYGDSYDVYLNITNPLQDGTNDITKDQLRKFVEAIAEEEDYGIENYGYGATIDSVTDSVYGKSDFGMLMDLNISCVGNMVEAVELFNKVNGTDYNGIVAPTETVAFYPNQIKNVANEKPTADPDIRFSIKMSSSAREVLESNPELKLIFENLQNQMKLSDGYVPDGKRIHKFAADLRKEVETTLPVAELENDLQEIYKVLASIEDSEGYEYAWDLTVELAQKMITNSRVLDDLNAEKKDLRERLSKYLKGRKFYLSPSMKAEIESYYDTYGNFHRKIFGRGFSFSENATSTLESEWNDLCAELPELFDPDTHVVEQPIALLEAFNTTEWKYGLFDEYQYDSQVKYTATEIMNTLTDIPTTTTLLDKITEKQYNEIASLNSENRKKINELKQQYSEDLERISSEKEARYKLQIKKNMEQKKSAEIRGQIEKQIVRLSDMLAHGKKNRHIPLKLIDAVRDLCYVVTLNRAAQNKLGENLGIIEASYAALNDGKDGPDGELNSQFLKNAYDEYVHGLIKDLGSVLRHKSVANMTLAELIQVNETVKAVAQRVTRANELHIESRNAGVEETANAIGTELGAPKVKREFSSDVLNNVSDKADVEAWKFLKPVYAWRMIGSETFTELMGNIRAGEDTWAVDMKEAKEKIDTLAQKYNKKTWEKGKIEVELSSGTYSFSVQQLMMLYVAQQREQYLPHLLGNSNSESPTGRVGGGFVFEDAYKTVESKKDGTKKKPKVYRERDAGTHTLTENDLEIITEKLTAEQRGYANEMRDYLAQDLAVKGNEITRVLYDMNKFTEEKYFPIKVAREFLDGTMKEPEVRSVLSQSMLKDLQEKAANPILLRDFDAVWAEHVQQMAMFHSFALPLDDYQRVFNFRTTKGKATSIKTQIETSCGKGAISYIENFVKDVNGGVRNQNGSELVNTMMSKFKKGAVFASASVTIQQPSAIARALAEVDPKYFTNPTISKKDYEELMKYAPIARIKAMGFFDTSIGQSTVDWLTSEQYSTTKEKIGALLSTKDSSYRDEVLSKAPELMDEITWCNIWHAVKKETAAKTGLSGEELLKASGKRFSQVIELTQVYDSVFSKSELMRSKDTGVKMVTAFMAEPTVSLNMLVDAVIQAKRGNLKGGGRYVGAFVASVILNNILKALVTAPRDEDEEKTLVEKYISNAIGGIQGDLNPLSLIPIAKDVISIFDGYSVERADMTLVQNLYDAIEDLSSDKKNGFQKGLGVANALSAFLGIPLKNITRDGKATLNLFKGFLTVGDTTAEGIKQAVTEDSNGSLWNKYIKPFILGSPEDRLYNAIKSDDYSSYEKLQKNEYGGDSTKVNAAIREGLINNDERVTLAAKARLDKDFYSYDKYVREISRDGFSNENVVKAVNKVYSEFTEAGESSTEREDKYYSLYSSEDLNNALETGGDYETVINDMIETSMKNGSTRQSAESSVKTRIASYWKEVYFSASEQERKDIEKLLDDTGLYRDIEETTSGWVYSILKEEYISAESAAERNRIKQEIWKSGYFSTRRKMNDSLEKLLEGKDE